MSDGNGGREALAEALGNEMGVDLHEQFMASVDRVLTALFLLGYVVMPITDEDNQ